MCSVKTIAHAFSRKASSSLDERERRDGMEVASAPSKPASKQASAMVSDSEHEVIASPISPRSVLSSISSSPSSSSYGEAPAPVPAAGACTTDGLDRVVRNGKIYSKKKANMPYLKGGHTWKEREARQRQRRAVAKESSPPHERTEQVSRSIMRYTVVLVVGSLLLSRMMTESWTFGYTGRWSNYRNWIPRPVGWT